MQANPLWDILLSNKFDPEAHQPRELWAPGVAEALSTSLNPTHDFGSPNSRHPPFQPKPKTFAKSILLYAASKPARLQVCRNCLQVV